MAFVVTLAQVEEHNNQFDCLAVFENSESGQGFKEHLFGRNLNEIKQAARRRIVELRRAAETS